MKIPGKTTNQQRQYLLFVEVLFEPTGKSLYEGCAQKDECDVDICFHCRS